eukprot:26379_1
MNPLLEKTQTYYKSFQNSITHFYTIDANILTPTAKLVYTQWELDANDELLIHGYCRRRSSSPYLLPIEIETIISSFYNKAYSKAQLCEQFTVMRRKKQQQQEQEETARRKRKENLEKRKHFILQCYHSCCFCMVPITVALCSVGIILASDIASLVINSKYDCTVDTNRPSEISQFLLYGSVCHICLVYVCIVYLGIECFCEKAFNCFEVLVMVLWSLCLVCTVLGMRLYSNRSKIMNKQCANMVVSQTVIKLVEWLIVNCICCVAKCGKMNNNTM